MRGGGCAAEVVVVVVGVAAGVSMDCDELIA